MSGARKLDQTGGDVALLGGRPAAALAGEFESRLRSREREYATIDERIVNDDVGLREAGERSERQQPRVSGSGAGEPDMPRREHGGIGAHGCASVVHRTCLKSDATRSM